MFNACWLGRGGARGAAAWVMIIGAGAWAAAGAACPAWAAYEAPAGYYDAATGMGAPGVLMAQLEAIMTAGHRQTTYGDARAALAITDQDPSDPGRMLMVYTRASNPAQWQSGLYQTREHVWASTRMVDGRGSNSTRGPYGDLHLLKPADGPSNGARGVRSFAYGDTTGSNRAVDDYYYPGDADRGDIARIAFYTATRWRTEYGVKLVNGAGDESKREMGDLASLLRWHYLDTPDTFELRRNDVIYDNYTNNRNAYIDRPEFAWAVFVDNENDTRLSVGGAADVNGGSSAVVDFGRVLRGTAVAHQAVTLNKAGDDGTYYAVTASGAAVSASVGRYHAFAIGGPGQAAIDVGLADNATDTAGVRTGSIVIDNLDVTTGGGAGRGANDADDVIAVSATVVDASHASFGASEAVDTLTIDLGTITQGTGDAARLAEVFNLTADSGFTAGLDLDAVELIGGEDTASIVLDLALFEDLAGGSGAAFAVGLDDSVLGSFHETYALRFSDADDVLGGSSPGSAVLMLEITGTVVPEPAMVGVLVVAMGAWLLRRCAA